MQSVYQHPYDTPVSAGCRFLSELIAWTAGPWAAAVWSKWLVVPVLVLLIGLPAIFSTPNDKKKIVIATPGPARVGIEMLLYTVAVVATWSIWPPVAATVATIVVLLALIAGIPRIVWLWRGANS